MANIPQMDWSPSDHSEALTLFKQEINLYIQDEKEAAAKARKICRGIGDEGLKLLNASSLTDTQKKDPAELWKFLEGQLKSR